MIVLIPCFNRPEFLTVCLEQIQKADGAEKHTYIFCKDWNFDESINPVIEAFPLSKAVIETPNIRNKHGQQSFNVLNGWMYGAKNSDIVCLIEDDIMIGKDFFTWHEDILNNVECFCSIATVNHNTLHNCTGDPDAYYFGTHTDYQSWGLAFKSDVILKYLYPHFVSAYFSDTNGYIKKNFPESTIHPGFTEQDGLIRRIMEKQKEMKPVFPHVPRAFHSGFYSYHRGTAKHYSPHQIKSIIFDPAKFRKACGKYQDSEVCNLETKHETIKLMQP